ncbi:MAG TPA: FtsX-like permease family protein [Streptosporangiaceae bacterium]|jgi:hypothetical protein
MRSARLIGLALRLSVSGGRTAVARLLIIAGSVALGVTLLLMALAGVNAVNAQNARFAWLATGAGSAATPVPPGVQPLWASITADNFDGQQILRVDVAATGSHSPVPPGIPALPGPGQFYASPALSWLIRSVPGGELAARYPGRQAGLIGRVALPSPDSLIVIVGYRADQLAGRPGIARVTAINTVTPSSCGNCAPGVGNDASAIDLILSIVAVALLLPVLIFIGSATRLSAARRELRLAAMRLAGATARQVSVIAAVESVLAAAIGTLAGFGLFFAVRPEIAATSFAGQPFYVADLSLSLPDILLAGLGVPLGAAVAARWALRRVVVSPLGVARQVTPRPPRAWRVLPLAAGVAGLLYALVAPHPHSTGGQVLLYVPGFALIVAGLAIAGPWLTWLGARLLARRASRPATLIAGRRLADNPRAGFRAISGLVLALFIGTVAVATLTGFTAHRGVSRASAAASHVLVQEINLTDAGPDAGGPLLTSMPPGLNARLARIPGVRAVAALRIAPRGLPMSGGAYSGLISCAQLARITALGRCAPGAVVAQIAPFVTGSGRRTVWPGAPVSPARLAARPIGLIAVATSGTTAAIERARTTLEQAFPLANTAPHTIGEINADNARQAEQFQDLADVVIAVSLVVAGCSLAVTCTAGLNERKRPFSLMRLTGARLRTLRRVIALETVMPLLAAAVVAIAVGFAAAQLFLSSQLGYNLQPPPASYYLTVGAGLIASLGIIASTFPLLRRVTSPETARTE